eukprot:COSAG03_NODE_20781_length_313_cov_799.766355_1_plen_76_part_01
MTVMANRQTDGHDRQTGMTERQRQTDIQVRYCCPQSDLAVRQSGQVGRQAGRPPGRPAGGLTSSITLSAPSAVLLP